jgi:hypothetical protein
MEQKRKLNKAYRYDERNGWGLFCILIFIFIKNDWSSSRITNKRNYLPTN